MIPKSFFLTKGVGKHKDQLASFELALRDAGIERFNIVSVSSILPPNCKQISKTDGLQQLQSGSVVFVVISRNASNEPNRLIAASVGVAIPSDSSQHGYLSEHHSFGETDEKAGDYAEDLAASMLASTLGIEFDVNSAWNEKEHLFKMSEKIVKTMNISQSAICDKNGLWTTVVTSAVFIV